MKTTDYISFFESRIPASLRCEWDNDGLMVGGEEREVRKILFTLDLTREAAEYAVSGGFDLVVTHHPLIFTPLKAVTDPRILSMIRAGITVLSYHTRLDALDGGVNDALVSLLGLRDVRPFGECGMGRIGYLPALADLDSLALDVKKLLGCPTVTVVGKNRPVCFLAVLGGGGKDFIEDARLEGADAFLTGEASYNALSDSESMPVLCAGHYYTEQPVLGVLEKMARSLDPDVKTEIFACVRERVLQ